MEKLKCPEIRFQQFKEAWSETTLGNLSQIRRGASPRPIEDPKWFDNDGVFGWLRIADVTQQNGRIFDIEQKLSVEGQKKTLILEEPHLILSIAATVGKPVINYVPTGIHDGFIVFLNLDADREFIFQWLERFRPNWFKLGQPGSQLNLNSELVKNQSIFLSPLMEEQTQIGNFFKNLDQSIALQEKKLTQTQNLKKAMLERMFPKAGSTQPEIRLKGFSGDWALQPLENIFGKIRNAFVGTATPYYVKSGRFYLESNNVKDGKINRKSEIFINDYFYYKQQDKWLKTNDIVMVQSGHVGHAAVITEELNNLAAHALIIFTDFKVDADPHFINYQIQTDKTKNEIEKITTGNTIKHILSSDMKKFSLLFPCVKEQIQIGRFFKQLDETLALQQQQLQTLKNLKQAFLEKMFV